ncbi:hypothetical protein D0Z07_7490 [Hyphodiscus hymeniophilus]|uniref:NADP-dependent oxidoreductase domain-containing protein n=1 Tax=Hyphodiscus hymeniophilus TaxID=353542 RepID=A0A9P7AU51_9HELO|nr:hypothetical protein D0Z07_7490 [Hyphodiscus hymeniophilus]
MAANSYVNATQESVKAAHVNMMTDTIIASLPPKHSDPSFEACSASMRRRNARPLLLYRCLMGCGQGFDALRALTDVIGQISKLMWSSEAMIAWGSTLYEALANTLTGFIDQVGPSSWNSSKWADGKEFREALAKIDGDVLQAVTAIQKELSSSAGGRSLSHDEMLLLSSLRGIISVCESQARIRGLDVQFQRGQARVEIMLWKNTFFPRSLTPAFVSSSGDLEMFRLGRSLVPRLFMGLWQFSSPAWGSASRSQIHDGFRKHVDAGFSAYDMADHYADAEMTFGEFRSQQSDANRIYCATKWCIFEPVIVSEDLVESSITERLRFLHAQSIELLQFHWQDYSNTQYVKAAKLIRADARVMNLGLCNFDTQHMDEIIENGVQVASNQVQFSLIDLRPEFKMAESCRKNKVKLLTYGSLASLRFRAVSEPRY